MPYVFNASTGGPGLIWTAVVGNLPHGAGLESLHVVQRRDLRAVQEEGGVSRGFGRYTARMRSSLFLILLAMPLVAAVAPEGWTTEAVREEIRPKFEWSAKGGRSGAGAFVIETDSRDGLDGFWRRSIPVEGGKFYRFEAWRRVTGSQWPQ